MPPPAADAAAWTALPLVVASSSDRSLVVPEAAAAFLQSLRAPAVRVLGLFGPPHTGKRLLLKTLLHADAASFAGAGNGTRDGHDCVLLWLWWPTQPTSTDANDSVRLVVSLDAQQDDRADVRRARALLLLLSSVVLYNDDGEIDDAALARLDWLREIAPSLRITPNQDDDTVAADFHAHAPKFVWVQRKSKIKWLTDADTGEKMTATQYLDKCLAEESGFSDTVGKRNEQRMYFHSFFKQRECVALGREVEGAAPASLALAREELRVPFVEAVEKQLFAAYLSRSAHQLPVKNILGRELRADQLAHVLTVYVSAINSNALPAIQTAANTLLRKSVEGGIERARREYEGIIEAATTKDAAKPVTERSMVLIHWRGVQRTCLRLQLLQAGLPEQTKKTLFNEGLAALRADFAQRIESLVAQNASLSSELCDQLLRQLLPANLEKIASELEIRSRDSFSDGLVGLLTQYKSDLKDAVDNYKEQGAGPFLYTSLVDALLASVFESIKTYGASVLRQYQQHMRDFQEKLVHVEQDLKIAKSQDTSASFSAEDQKRLYEELLEQSTEQLSELRRVLLGELNAKKSELDRIMNDLGGMDAKHEIRISNMESDLAWVRSRIEEMEKVAQAERERLEKAVSGATEEMLVKERTYHQEERSLFLQQKEMLARVVDLERELVQKKTKHVQQVFSVESEIVKRVDEIKQEQAEFARQLKSQAKTDTGVLRLAYQKKKAVVQSEIDRASREIKEYEEKLKAFEMVKSPTLKASASLSGSARAAKKSEATNVVAALRTSSREFLFKSPDAVESLKGAASASRNDTEMCKTQ